MNKRNEKAITLIALVVTIVVLLILAGVSISMLTGENGIISQAQDAKKGNKEAEIEEQVRLAVMAARSANAGDLKIESLNSELKKIGNNKDITSLPDTIEIKGVKISIDEKGNTEIVGTGKDEEEEPPVVLEPGLYDENNNLVATWDDLVNTYGMNITKNYTYINYKGTNSPNYVFNKNSELKTGTKLIIDDSITTIGERAFWDCSQLTDVVLGDNITTLGLYAFRANKNLTNIIFNDKLTTIGDWAFAYCENLESITLPESLVTINTMAFYSCDKLTSVNIPANVTSIDSDSFGSCINLKSLTVDSSNTTYTSDNGILLNEKENKLVYCSTGFSGNYSIPYGITLIEMDAFDGCSGLTSISIPSTVETIDSYAFRDCTGLTSVNLPSKLTEIESHLFSGCTNLASVNIPSNVETIYSSAFENCTSLTNITIPSKVDWIWSGAFEGCTNLTEVIFNIDDEEAMWELDAYIYNDETETHEQLYATIYCSALKDTSTAAKYLTETYVEYNWRRW